MSCTRPLDGYRARGGSVIIVARGDRPPRDSLTKVPLAIPCGKCIGCRMKKAREWGIRCLHEKKMWKYNSYVTLTYDDEHMPRGMSVSMRDVQLFMKRLRKRRGANASNPIRFFAGAEYGELNARPHYHVLLFNCGFRDCVLHGTNKRGERLYTSGELSHLWPFGFSTIGDVTFDSAVYCAKYAIKKVNGDAAYEHYMVYDENGELYQREPEFALMSRFPGIGGMYFDKYGVEAVTHDSVVIDGKELPVPRYYDERAKQSDRLPAGVHSEVGLLCNCRVCVNKRRRKREAVLNMDDNTEERLRVKERIMVIAAEKKERKL